MKGQTDSGSMAMPLPSPIQKLPTELLEELFALSCGPIDLNVDALELPAMMLSQVDRTWRDIACSTALLWSSLSINLDCEARYWPLLVNLILLRSQQMPLHLVLLFDSGEEDDVKSDLSETAVRILQYLVQHCHRWQNLSLTVPMDVLRCILVEPIRESLPSLCSLTLDMTSRSPTVELITLFDACPNLRHFNATSLESDQVEIPLGQLRTLTLNECEFDFTIQVIRSCSKLEALTLEGIELWDPDLLADISHVWTNITHLRASPLTIFDDPVFFPLEALTAPLLHTLVLDRQAPGRMIFADVVHPIKAFLARSSCNITSLSIANIAFADSTVIEILWLMPTITSLTIHELKWPPKSNEVGGQNTMLTQKLWKSLHLRSIAHEAVLLHAQRSVSTGAAAPIFLPRITSLDLRAWDDGEEWLRALVDAVISRRPSSPEYASSNEIHLTSFQFIITTKSTSQINPSSLLARLELLEKEGLRVEIAYRRPALRYYTSYDFTSYSFV